MITILCLWFHLISYVIMVIDKKRKAFILSLIMWASTLVGMIFSILMIYN